MSRKIDADINKILKYLYDRAKTKGDSEYSNGSEISGSLELSASEVNDAVTLLEDNGFAETLQALGTAPYIFAFTRITSRGKYEVQRREAQDSAIPKIISGEVTSVSNYDMASGLNALYKVLNRTRLIKPSTPVGSPFGFEDIDWEYVAEEKSRQDKLKVVLGCQYESEHYDIPKLQKNVESMFLKALDNYNASPNAITKTLNFLLLAAGYGEHVFNEIAREIISADIAVFETSDMNPNVMIEMGVALTYGIRVLPIKLTGQPKPPSDISGQTWAGYQDNASIFPDPEHDNKLFRMVDRASRKKRTS